MSRFTIRKTAGEAAVQNIDGDTMCTLPEDARAALVFSILVKRNGPAKETEWNSVNSSLSLSEDCIQAAVLDNSQVALLYAPQRWNEQRQILVRSVCFL